MVGCLVWLLVLIMPSSSFYFIVFFKFAARRVLIIHCVWMSSPCLHVKSLCVVVMPDLWWLLHKIMYVCHYVWSHNSTLQYGASDRWGARDCAPWSRRSFIVDTTMKSSIRGHLEWRGEISSSNNHFNFYVVFDF